MKTPCLRLFALFAAFACGESGSSTTEASTGTTATADSTGWGTTAGVPTTGSSGDIPTGGSGSGTDGATGTTGTVDTGSTGSTGDNPSGSGSGGEGSGMACAKWYDALVESYRPQCECQVSLGMYPSVEDCLAATVPPASCTCEIFAQSPQTAEQLKCYEKAAMDKAECLDGLGLCGGELELKLCDDLELTALLLCGSPPKEICDAIAMTCDDAPPLICLL